MADVVLVRKLNPWRGRKARPAVGVCPEVAVPVERVRCSLLNPRNVHEFLVRRKKILQDACEARGGPACGTRVRLGTAWQAVLGREDALVFARVEVQTPVLPRLVVAVPTAVDPHRRGAAGADAAVLVADEGVPALEDDLARGEPNRDRELGVLGREG